MNIIIVGAGRVGSSVAENLVGEENDITVVDIDHTPLGYLQERLDLRTVHGDGSFPNVLAEAGVLDADLIVACTANDAVNLVTCKIAQEIYNVPRRIARLRTNYYVDHPDFAHEHFSVDSIISPEIKVTEYLFSLIEYPEVIQVVDFAQGLVNVMVLKVGKTSPMIKQQIDKEHLNLPDLNGRILEVMRDGQVLPLTRSFTLQADDELIIAVEAYEVKEAVKRLNHEATKVRRVMIAGGGNIGARLATWLVSENYHVKLIEANPERAQYLASHLPDEVLVLQGDGTDEGLLVNEGISDMDTWLALMNDDEDNIMSSLLAKRLGARKVISLISRKSYGELMQGSMIDIAVSPSLATIGALLRDVRQGSIVRGHRLRLGQSEAIEFEVIGNKKSSRVVGRPLNKIRWPKFSVLAMIVRNGQIIIPTDDTIIQEEDHVIVYAPNRKTMKRVEMLFEVSALFF